MVVSVEILNGLNSVGDLVSPNIRDIVSPNSRDFVSPNSRDFISLNSVEILYDPWPTIMGRTIEILYDETGLLLEKIGPLSYQTSVKAMRNPEVPQNSLTANSHMPCQHYDKVLGWQLATWWLGIYEPAVQLVLAIRFLCQTVCLSMNSTSQLSKFCHALTMSLAIL